MKKRKFLAALLAGVMALSVLAGCQSDPGQTPSEGASSTGEASTPNEETVELTFYMTNAAVNDFDRILEKANEIIKEEINATLNLVMLDGNTYGERINLMIQTGDAYDLCFMSDWGGMNYYQNATEGAFADLTEKLPEIAPETYKLVPESIWNNVTVNGKIYGVFNYQQWGYAARKGFAVNSNIADEFNFDWKSLKGTDPITVMNAFTGLFEQALAKYPDKIGFETSGGCGLYYNEPLLWDMEAVGDITTPGWVRIDEPETIINQFATEEFEQFCNIMHDWYNKGYVLADGATVVDTTANRKAGKYVAEVKYGWPDSVDFPGNENAQYMSLATREIAPCYTFSTSRTMMPAGVNACIAISADSPNIDKSLELIELLNTNDELYMLLCYGEEGVDYKFDEEGNYELIDGMYNFNGSDYQIGSSYSPNFTRALYHKNEAGDLQKESQSIVFEADKTADASPMAGFLFNSDPVKTELANCAAVLDEILPGLTAGATDPATALPELLQRLENAGVNKIIEEKQAQVDAWRAANS